MINDITITFNHNGLQHTLCIPNTIIEDDNNLPYNIAEAVKQLIHFSDANPDIIIKDLIDEYGYEGEEQ